MILTTPPRVDLGTIFPGMVELRRPAVRLHPRRGAVDESMSSVGGPLFGMPDPWPTCVGNHEPVDDWDGPFPPGTAIPVVPVAQLWRRDVPQLPFPDGTDLCQITWCPLAHPPDYGPLVLGWWRDSIEFDPSRRESTAVPDGPRDENLVPRPCTVSPEPIVEYPTDVELPDRWYQEIVPWARARGERPELYRFHYGCAPGTKVGGWPAWWSEGVGSMECDAGHAMRVMLSVASWEFDKYSQQTWQPREEQGTLQGREDAGLTILDAGRTFIFVCDVCDDRPMKSLTQG